MNQPKRSIKPADVRVSAIAVVIALVCVFIAAWKFLFPEHMKIAFFYILFNPLVIGVAIGLLLGFAVCVLWSTVDFVHRKWFSDKAPWIFRFYASIVIVAIAVAFFGVLAMYWFD